MKGKENKDYEWVRPLNKYLYKISSVSQEYECEDIESLLGHIKSNIWQSDYIISRGIIQDSILEAEELIENLPNLFKDLTHYQGDNGEYFDKDDIIRITTHNLDRLLKELKSLQKVILRKIKASLPGGIEKDGIRIKSHATAESLVALFSELRTQNIIFDKDLSSVFLSEFISSNFSTEESRSTPLSVENLENLFSANSTSASSQFIYKLKSVINKLSKKSPLIIDND